MSAPTAEAYSVPYSYGSVPLAEVKSYKEQEQKNILASDDSAPPKKFRDVFYAFAFLLHLAFMFYIYAGSDKGLTDLVDDGSEINDSKNEVDVHITFFLVFLGITAVGISLGHFYLIRSQPELILKICMIGYCGYSLILGICMISSGSFWIAFFGVIQFLMVCWYMQSFWHFIPFSAANLSTAMTALLGNLGIALVGVVASVLSVSWLFVWSVTFNKIASIDCDNGDDDTCEGISYLYYFLLVCSLFWTSFVISYSLHCTVAGVVGTWWTTPSEADSCCSPAVVNSLFRALTYSFGSVCKGAFLIALIKALRALADYIREEERRSGNERNELGAIILCLVSCILSLVEDILEYVNEWAFTYVGLYGFDYIDAGKEVFNLFKARGWTVIVANDLTSFVTFFSILTTAIINGLMAIVVNPFGLSVGAVFGIGALIGIGISIMLFSIVSGAVNATIVCLAEMPAELEQNHTIQSEKIRNAWLNVYPNSLSFALSI